LAGRVNDIVLGCIFENQIKAIQAEAAISEDDLQARAKLGFPMATPELRDEVLAKLKDAGLLQDEVLGNTLEAQA
jgi:hypothetical protein